MDWDSVNIHYPADMAGNYGAGLINTPHGAFNWSTGVGYQPAKFFLFDVASMNWKALPSTGAASPGYYADANGVVYDGKRDRVLWFSQGAAYSYSFVDHICTNLHPADSALSVGDDHFRECVYVPGQDIVIMEIQKNGGHLMYDCAANQWRVFAVSGMTMSVGRSEGMMYDARRNLIWLNSGTIYAMRPDTGHGTTVEAPGGPLLTAALKVSPNPFNPASRIRVSMPAAGHLRLAVYRTDGRLLQTLAQGGFAAGVHMFTWKGLDAAGRRMPAGVYIYRLTAGNKVLTQKTILVE
jgi:hypothetical protein